MQKNAEYSVYRMHTLREGQAYGTRELLDLLIHKAFSLKSVPQSSDKRYSAADLENIKF